MVKKFDTSVKLETQNREWDIIHHLMLLVQVQVQLLVQVLVYI